MKLVYIVTSPLTANVLLRGQLNALIEAGHDVSIIVGPGEELAEVRRREKATVFAVPMEREISLLRDIYSLLLVTRLLFRLKPDLVNASTPKAGLLGMIAAWLNRVPTRVFQQRGLRLETTTGFKYRLLYFFEKLTATCATHIVCNSHSLRKTYIKLKLAKPAKLRVLGAGSSNGVNTQRFHKVSALERSQQRKQFSVPDDAFVIGFVGRLTRDKGIADLFEAFQIVSAEVPSAYLLLIGPVEEGDALPASLLKDLRDHARVKVVGMVADTAPYYSVMDVFAFPSYREGFPNAPLEAAASGVATVGYAATGTIDAVEDRVSGLLVPVGDVDALTRQIRSVALDNEQLLVLNEASYQRAVTQFDSRQVWRNWVEFYRVFENKSVSRRRQATV